MHPPFPNLSSGTFQKMLTTPVRPGSHERTDFRQRSSLIVVTLTALAGALRDLANRVARAQQRRRDVDALSALDDDQLQDIGLARDQIACAVAERARHPATSRRR